MNTAPLAQALWTYLWDPYCNRVTYARMYEAMIQAAGGAIANDHIAFRSVRLTIDSPEGPMNLGIPYLAEKIELLGYEFAEDYIFPDRHLYAHSYCHPQQDEFDLPKLFISELIVNDLPVSIAEQIRETVQSGTFCPLTAWQRHLQDHSPSQNDEADPDLLHQMATVFTRPWTPPRRRVVEAVNAVSQYGAWVLLHGYAVNHFTGYINRHQTSAYPDIASTVQRLKRQGIPMKDTLEGSKATGLQQIATHAVIEPVTVMDDDGTLNEMSWSYAYYELAERHLVETASGQKVLFEGFIGPQANHLFDMTRTR